jgi:AcrR family transcriptional regulator
MAASPPAHQLLAVKESGRARRGVSNVSPDPVRHSAARRLPLSELTLAIALIMAIYGLATIETTRGRWAMAGALILGLLAGLEIQSRDRKQGESDASSCSPAASAAHEITPLSLSRCRGTGAAMNPLGRSPHDHLRAVVLVATLLVGAGFDGLVLLRRARETMGQRPKRLTRAERQQQTRQALLDAAARVFVRRGLQASSVEEISAEAGYTRGAFYSNFSSKDELFVELLHDRVYARYTAMYEEGIQDPKRAPTLRQTGEMLAAMQARNEDRWLFRLWFESLAQAGRDDQLRQLAATFWRGNRSRGEKLIEAAMPSQADRAKAISTAMIALDIGLAIQHFVDPDDVPLDLYPELYVLLFGSFARQERKPPSTKTKRATLRAGKATS